MYTYTDGHEHSMRLHMHKPVQVSDYVEHVHNKVYNAWWHTDGLKWWSLYLEWSDRHC